MDITNNTIDLDSIITFRLREAIINMCQDALEYKIKFKLDDIVKTVNYPAPVDNLLEVNCLVCKSYLETSEFTDNIREHSNDYFEYDSDVLDEYNVNDILNDLADSYAEQNDLETAEDWEEFFDTYDIPKIPCVFKFFQIEPFDYEETEIGKFDDSDIIEELADELDKILIKFINDNYKDEMPIEEVVQAFKNEYEYKTRGIPDVWIETRVKFLLKYRIATNNDKNKLTPADIEPTLDVKDLNI